MAKIHFENEAYSLNEGDSVLDTLLEAGHDIPFSCKEGACQSCLMKLEEGSLPPESQAGLSEVQVKLGYFMSCSCKPSADLKVAQVDAGQLTVESKIITIDQLNDSILRLRLEAVFDFLSGQYISIWIDDNTTRSYSLASVKAVDNFIELHIKVIPDGIFSDKYCRRLNIGDKLKIQGPIGKCIYATNNKSQALLLAGIGTGLAPLYGILRDALHQGHEGPIHLIVGAKQASNFYLVEELNQIAAKNSQVKVTFIAQENNNQSACETGDLYQYVAEQYPSTKDMRVYLCGAKTFIKKLRKQCFLAGADRDCIHMDVFLPG